MDLTKAQQAIYMEFVRRAEAGQPPPSHRELMSRFGWKSPAAARKHIAALVKKGALKLEPGASRGAHLQDPLPGKVALIEELDRNGWPKKTIQVIPLPVQLHPGDPAVAFSVTDHRLRSVGLRTSDLAIATLKPPTEKDELVLVAEGGKPRVMTLRRATDEHHKIVGTVKVVIRFFGPVDGEVG
jgi:repressor LexA